MLSRGHAPFKSGPEASTDSGLWGADGSSWKREEEAAKPDVFDASML